VQVTRVRP